MSFSIFSDPKCLSGSEFGLMVSGMSKFSRRKMAELACWCAFDLYLAGFQSVNNEKEKRTRENYRSRFVNRFPVAVIEDSMPKCWWVLKHIKKFTEKTLSSYRENVIDLDVLKIIHHLLTNIAYQDKCRMLQHLREVGDEEFKKIESAKPSQAVRIFNECIKDFDDYEKDIINSCIYVYNCRKKPIILSAAFSYVKYHKLFEKPRIIKYKNFNEVFQIYIDGKTPKWETYPYLFDKHVSPSISKRYGVSPIKGWKGFIENEEQVCWDNGAEEMKNNDYCIELKKKYYEKRLNQ